MILERDGNHQCAYELEVELKELKSNFASLGERCQLVELSRDALEHKLANIAGKVPSLEATLDEKERDLQKALLVYAMVWSSCLDW